MTSLGLALFLVLIGTGSQGEKLTNIDHNAIDSASLPVEHRGGGFGVPVLDPSGPPSGGYGAPLGGVPFGEGNALGTWPLAQPDMPTIKNLQVQCEKSFMRISIEFDRPFYGMIFSKGYYSDPSCIHLQPQSGVLQAQFDIYLNTCGMTASSGDYGQPSPGGAFIENTVIIQYDPLVQEVWDAARKLRCTWYDYYEKSVTFRPFQVDMLNAVTANFLGDNLQCWMQIQVGKGPWASEVSGIVKIGQTMTMVLAIKDDENKFDMLVRNCVAHDGKRAPIELVDQNGCVVRPKIMGRFQKVKDFGPSASVVSYAFFQAFKFPDSMNVHFQCVIQVCRHQCPEPLCGGGFPIGGYHAAASEQEEISVPAPEESNVDPRQASLVSDVKAEDEPSRHQKRNSISREDSQSLPVPYAIPGHSKGGSLMLPKLDNKYPSVARVGSIEPDALLGRPRSLDLDKVDPKSMPEAKERKRRSLWKREVVEMTDIATERVIQVVAPGDLAFNLNTPNETVVITSELMDGSHICMSTAGFAAGLIMLLLVLTIACLVACFLYSRVRMFDAKETITTFVQGYDNPEFVKVGPPQ